MSWHGYNCREDFVLKTNDTMKGGLVPNEVVGERDAVQPILCAMLLVSSTIGDVPGREDIQREQYCPPMYKTSNGRFIDYETGLHSPIRFAPIATDGSRNSSRGKEHLSQESECREKAQ